MKRFSPHPAHFETIPLEPHSSFHLMRARGKGYHLYLHYHPEIELTLIVRGRGMRFVGDSVQPFEDGDLCLLGSSLLHSWYTGDTPQHTEAIVIQFTPGMLQRLAEEWPELRRLPEILARCERGLTYAGRQRAMIAGLMHEAATAPAGSAQRLALLLQILEALHRAADVKPISAAPPMPASADPNLSRFQQVMRELHERMPDAPEQAEMAKYASMTPAGFSRFFKRMVGRSYVDYVNAWRIGLACRQLMHTGAPITRVALDCGFENLSNFNRRFRQYKRTTPREYRRLARVG